LRGGQLRPGRAGKHMHVKMFQLFLIRHQPRG